MYKMYKEKITAEYLINGALKNQSNIPIFYKS